GDRRDPARDPTFPVAPDLAGPWCAARDPGPDRGTDIGGWHPPGTRSPSTQAWPADSQTEPRRAERLQHRPATGRDRDEYSWRRGDGDREDHDRAGGGGSRRGSVAAAGHRPAVAGRLP